MAIDRKGRERGKAGNRAAFEIEAVVQAEPSVTWAANSGDAVLAAKLGIVEALVARPRSVVDAEAAAIQSDATDLTDAEWATLAPLCAGFKQNYVAKRTHRETISNALWLATHRTSYSHLPPERDSPDCARMRFRSWASRGRWLMIYEAARESGSWSSTRLQLLKNIADWESKIVARVAAKRQAARDSVAHRSAPAFKS